MRKRARTLILTGVAVVLAATGFRVAAAWPPFRDLRDHWAASIVNAAVGRGWLTGYEDGQFKPDAPMTRAEFFKLLVAAMRLQAEPGAPLPFAESDHWAAQQGWLQAAIKAGVLKPSDYGQNFNPDWSVTRQEALLAVVRVTGGEGLALSLPGAPLTVGDPGAVAPWLQGWVAVGLEEGLIKGDVDGQLHLSESASRAEATTMVQRAIDRVTPAITAFEGKTSQAGRRYPAPGEPVWESGAKAGLAPSVMSGTFQYVLPAFANGITINPAPGGAAWIGYTIDGASSEQLYQVFAYARDGRLTEVRKQPLSGPFETPLTVDGSGRLTIMVGGAIKRLDREGVAETIADNQPLSQAVYTADGTLWGVGNGPGQLLRWDLKGGWQQIPLSVQASEQIESLHPSPKGGIWILLYDARLHQTRAVEVAGTQIKRDLLLIPENLHGADPMPARTLIQGTDELWLVRESRTGEGATAQNGYLRFDLRSGALMPLVAPPQLKGPFVLRPSISGGALLGDGEGRFWQLLPLQ